MRTRPLGASGIEASTVAFGAWAIGGWTWGGADDDESIRAIHAFLDAGGTLIDTAPVYGFGRSEEVVGRAIRGRRDRVVLATKCAMRWDLTDAQKRRANKRFATTEETIDWTGDATGDTFDVYIYAGADGIREEVERSLQRLGTDHIDLYQTHWQMDDVAIAEKMGVLQELKAEGKIRAIGVSNASPEEVEGHLAAGQLDVDQERYSMLDREQESANLPVCEREGVAFLAYSPLAQGLLTGKIAADRKYAEGDLRATKERFAPDNVRRVQAMLEAMHPIAETHGVSLAQTTIAWTLAQPGCTHTLCGARTPEQAIENAGAGSVELSEDELRTITAAVEAYDGV